jgi:hypothetical protein
MLAPTDVTQFKDDGILVIVFDWDLPQGKGMLTMDFTGTLNDQMMGFYRRYPLLLFMIGSSWLLATTNTWFTYWRGIMNRRFMPLISYRIIRNNYGFLLQCCYRCVLFLYILKDSLIQNPEIVYILLNNHQPIVNLTKQQTCFLNIINL